MSAAATPTQQPPHRTLRFALSGGALLLSLVLTGCTVGLSRPSLVKQYFLLEVPTTPSTAAPQYPVTVKVGGFEVAPPFEDRALTYRVDEQRFEADFYNEYFVAPRAMVTSRVVEWLSARHVFSAVLAPSSSLSAAYSLDGLVTKMYAEMPNSGQAKAVFAMQVFLTQTARAERPILFERTYSRELVLADRSAQTVAKGLSEAFQLCLADLERDLRNGNLALTQ